MIFSRRQRPMKDNSDLPYDVCSVHMNTCARLYRKWRNTRLRYRKAPVDGIPVKVEYVDVYPLPSATLHAVNSPPLTALCLHGAPGSHRDFRHLIVHLTARNIRVVAPNFPDYGLTKRTPLFVHSAEEKAEYIKDFLAAIKLNRIDLLICHSSSIFPAAILVTEWLESVKTGVGISNNNDYAVNGQPTNPNHLQPVASIGSLVLVNPCTQRPFRQIRPLLRQGVFRPSALLYQLRPSRIVIRFCGRIVLDVFGSPVDYNNFDNVILTLTTILNCGHKRMAPRMLKIAESQFPLTMIFSEKDRLIPKEHFQSFAQFLGIEQISHDDSDATHRSNSNQSSQASFEQTADDVDIEINNNMPDLHRLSLNEKSKSMFDLHSETDSLSEHRDSEPDIKGELDQLNRLNRLDALHQLSDQDDDLDTAPADTVDSGESECQSERSDASSLSADNKKDVFSMISSEGQINFNGPKQAVCISKAGHYSLISHSHVIAQQIDKLLAAYDLRTANQTLGALPLKE